MPTPERGPVGLESRSEGAKKTLFGSARSHAEQFGQLVKENRNKEPKQKAVKSCVIVFCTAQPRHLRFDLPIVQSCSFVFFLRELGRKPGNRMLRHVLSQQSHHGFWQVIIDTINCHQPIRVVKFSSASWKEFEVHHDHLLVGSS